MDFIHPMRRLRLPFIVIAVLMVLFVVARLAITPLSPRPANLGVTDGALAPCPSTPNCYASSVNNRPIPYSGTQADAHDRLVAIIENMPRTKVITDQPGYIHAEFRSALWGFIDDVEFYFDPQDSVIHYRSAARLGHGDMGVNRARIEDITAQFNNNS